MKIYQSRWNQFESWCTERKFDPHKADIHQVADFLIFLFKEKKFATKTIQGYRAAIAGALKLTTGEDLGADPRLSNLIQSFRAERPVTKDPFPKWDLTLVLHALVEKPFEPLGEVSIKILTLKTVFLVLLASGARRGEVHALDARSLSHAPDWSWITLHPVPEFLAKTQRRSEGASRFEGIKIRALAPSVGPDLQEGKALCPVRAVRCYLKRTEHFRKAQRRLFISYQENRSTDITVNTISIWIKNLLHLVFMASKTDWSDVSGRSTHAIRSWASSIAFFKNVALNDILQACTWKNHSTFSEFYLKDISEVRDDLFSLGPLSVAQSII